MASNIVLNGIVYSIPDIGEEDWGQSLTDFFIAIPQGVLQKTGGAFTLTADANFGANFGLLAKYFSTRSANPSTAGLIRLNLSDTIGWRNNANDGNLLLAVNGSNALTFNGAAIPLSGLIVNADIAANAAIAFSKLAALSSGLILVGSSGNVPTAVALSGDATLSDLGVITIGANKVTNAKAAQMAAHTFKGNNTGSTADPLDLSIAQMTSELSVTAPTASTLMGRDSNANSRVNSIIENFATTATAAGTTTLTVASAKTQQFTGSTTQTVVLPDATTLVVGQQFTILNRSSGVVTVNANGGGLVQSVAASSQSIVTVTSIGSAAGTWDSNYSAPSGSGTVTSVAMTLPSSVFTTPPSGSPITTSGTLAVALATQTARTFLSGPLSGSAAAPTFKALTAPTVQTFTSGSGTYTRPSSPVPLYIRVRMVGGGGGGSGSAATSSADMGNGGDGTDTTFGTTLLSAGKGSGAVMGGGTGPGGAGGSSSLGVGPVGLAVTGGRGQGNIQSPTVNFFGNGGNGGASALGGNGGGGEAGAAGTNAAANTGGGGGGGGAPSAGQSGSGGGAGGFIDAVITSPSATYAYVVGSGGAAGSAGTSGLAGGAGGSGFIEVTEYYQ